MFLDSLTEDAPVHLVTYRSEDTNLEVIKTPCLIRAPVTSESITAHEILSTFRRSAFVDSVHCCSAFMTASQASEKVSTIGVFWTTWVPPRGSHVSHLVIEAVRNHPRKVVRDYRAFRNALAVGVHLVRLIMTD